MKKQLEIDALYAIIEKLQAHYPLLLTFALEDFKDYYDLEEEDLDALHMNQVFLGWFFTKHELYDGKTIPQLVRQTLTLAKDEEAMLSSVEHAIIGYFEVLKYAEMAVTVRDLFTKKIYDVSIIDLPPLKKGVVIEAKIAHRLDGNLFFFGGFFFYPGKKKALIEDLEQYTQEPNDAKKR